jgi:hypothetical protein
MGRNRRREKTAIQFGCAVMVVLIVWALFLPHPAKTLPRGHPLVVEGITLTPVSVTEQSSIGSANAPPGRSFYVVHIELSNRSTEPYGYEMHQVLARAVDGDRIVRSGPGQEALGAVGAPETVLPYQTSERQIAFESTSGARQIAILFSLEGGPGLFLSGLVGKSEQVVCKVDPSGSPFRSGPKPLD